MYEMAMVEENEKVKFTKEECEWTHKHDDQTKQSFVKRWYEEYDVFEKIESN